MIKITDIDGKEWWVNVAHIVQVYIGQTDKPYSPSGLPALRPITVVAGVTTGIIHSEEKPESLVRRIRYTMAHPDVVL